MKALFAAAAVCELLLVSAASAFGDFAKPRQALIFTPLLLLAGIAFFLAIRSFESVPPRWHLRALWALALLLRIAIWPCAPGDDFWRYAWEGRVQNAGQNPYLLSPSSPQLANFRDAHTPQINHPEVAAIYPPATELIFAALTPISSSPHLFKIIFTAADLLTLALLLPVSGVKNAAWYAWNPAVVYAFAGAAHYDSLLLAALTAAVVALHLARGAFFRWQAASALGLAAAISLKLIPAILLPVWAFALGKRAWLLVVCLLLPIALTLPFGGVAITTQPFRDFAEVSRFNELLVWIFPNPWQRNWPVNTLLALVVAIIAVRFRGEWLRSALWVLGAALILSPVLHPWYATWILPLAVLRRQPAWTVLSLSALTAFLLWESTPLWTAWQPNLFTRTLVVLPPLLAWRFFPPTNEPAHR